MCFQECMDIVIITDKILHTNSQSFNYSLAGLLDCCYIWYKLCGATGAQWTEEEILFRLTVSPVFSLWLLSPTTKLQKNVSPFKWCIP